MEEASKRNAVIIVAVVLVLLGTAVYLLLREPAPSPVGEVPVPISQPPAGEKDLGSELYEKSANPISDRLPETISPIANPLENAYRNPFE